MRKSKKMGSRSAKPAIPSATAGKPLRSATRRRDVPPAPDVAKSAGASSIGSFITIDDQDVILLETNNHIGVSGLEDIVFRVFAAHASSRRSGTAWLAFGTTGRSHHSGKDSWIGLSRAVPLQVVERIQAHMMASGLQVEREMGRALHLNLNPFARLSDDGLEILVPAALVGDPSAKRIVPRGGTDPVARGYQIRPSRAAALNELFFGKL